MNSLIDIYQCVICLEPMKSAVSLNPCGHELDEVCALEILATDNKKCPVCRKDIDSFRPAYLTRQAIEILVPKMLNSMVTIQVKTITGAKITLNIERNCKVAKLFPAICKGLKIDPYRDIKLAANGKYISPFKYLHEYIPNDKSEYTFFANRFIGNWPEIAKKHPSIFHQALAEVGYNCNVHFLKLYGEAIDKAVNEI